MKLVFIHGSGGCGSLWHFQTQYFKDADAVDLPGHPSGELCTSIDEYAGWLHDYIKRKSYENVVLAGHSLGGGIALSYALRYQQDLHGIILVGSGARLRVMPQILEAIKSRLNDTQAWLNDLVTQFYATIDVKTRDMLMSALAAVGPAAQLNDMLCCDKFDVMDKIGSIMMPALAIVGDQDTMTPVKYAQYLVKNMPDCKIEIIGGGTHIVFLEKPEAVNQAIERFISATSNQGNGNNK